MMNFLSKCYRYTDELRVLRRQKYHIMGNARTAPKEKKAQLWTEFRKVSNVYISKLRDAEKAYMRDLSVSFCQNGDIQ